MRYQLRPLPEITTVTPPTQAPDDAPVETVIQLYNRLAHQYDHLYATPHALAENHYLSHTLKKWTAFDGARLLDIGCGTGLTLELARLANRELAPQAYFGLDPAAEMLAVARRKFPEHTFVLGTAERAHAWGAFPHVISLFGAFDYADPDAAFAALTHCTTSRVFLAVYGRQHQSAPGYILRSLQDRLSINTYTEAELRERLRHAGFTDIHIRGMSPPEFYRTIDTPVLLARKVGRLSRQTPPDDCCFLLARGVRRS